MRNYYILLFLITCFWGASAQTPSFTDVTSTAGISAVTNITPLFGSGASAADYDNDGDIDFFVGTEVGEISQLYRNDGNGQFTDVTSALRITSTMRVRTSLWFDYDGDDRLDLFLIGDCYGASSCADRVTAVLYQQGSNGNFTDVTTSAGITFGNKYNVSAVQKAIGGIAAADINNDGFLDLLIAIYGAEVTLFLNDGDGTFTDISVSSGLDGATEIFRWQPMFYDFDRDGWMDIYCTVDYNPNELWLNNGDGTFTESASTYGADHAYNEMGLTIADYDNDGDMDMYATNISRNDNGSLRHNMLLTNNIASTGTLGFTENSNTLGVGASGWDWGTTFFDVNNDGWVDLAATNGWNPPNWSVDRSNLWLNQGNGNFQDISVSSNFDDMLDATSLLAFDMDRDGDMDLLQTLKENGTDLTPARLYENGLDATASPGNYLVIKPRMNGNNHFAIGAVVKITYGSNTCMRLISAGTSFYGQEPAEAYFGVASQTTIEEVRVEWPDNTVTIVEDVAANQVLTVTNDVVLGLDDAIGQTAFIYPNPVNDILNLKAKEHVQQVILYDLLGQQILNKKIDPSTETQLDISNVNSGNYLLKIFFHENKGNIYYRVVKR